MLNNIDQYTMEELFNMLENTEGINNFYVCSDKLLFESGRAYKAVATFDVTTPSNRPQHLHVMVMPESGFGKSPKEALYNLVKSVKEE